MSQVGSMALLLDELYPVQRFLGRELFERQD